MRRLNHPAYRHRAQQFLADAVLVAIAWALAFVLRFVDAGGIPERYEEEYERGAIESASVSRARSLLGPGVRK